MSAAQTHHFSYYDAEVDAQCSVLVRTDSPDRILVELGGTRGHTTLYLSLSDAIALIAAIGRAVLPPHQ